MPTLSAPISCRRQSQTIRIRSIRGDRRQRAGSFLNAIWQLPPLQRKSDSSTLCIQDSLFKFSAHRIEVRSQIIFLDAAKRPDMMRNYRKVAPVV